MPKAYVNTVCIVILLLLFVVNIQAQISSSREDSLLQLPQKFINKVNNKAGQIEDRLTKKTAKYLSKL